MFHLQIVEKSCQGKCKCEEGYEYIIERNVCLKKIDYEDVCNEEI